MPNWVTNVVEFKNKEDLEKVRELVETEDNAFDLNKLIPQPEYISFTTSPSPLDIVFPAIMAYVVNETKSIDINVFNKYIADNTENNDDNVDELGLEMSLRNVKALYSYITISTYKFMNSNLGQTYDNLKKYYLENFINKCKLNEYNKLFFASPFIYNNGNLYDANYTIKDHPCKKFVKPVGEEVCLEMGKYYFGLFAKYRVLNWYDWRNKYWGTKWNTINQDIYDANNLIVFDTAWDSPTPAFEKIKRLIPGVEFTVYSMDEGTVGSLIVTKVENNTLSIFDTKDLGTEESEKYYDYAIKLIYGEEYDWKQELEDE